jgi:hypothetical protein
VQSLQAAAAEAMLRGFPPFPPFPPFRPLVFCRLRRDLASQGGMRRWLAQLAQLALPLCGFQDGPQRFCVLAAWIACPARARHRRCGGSRTALAPSALPFWSARRPGLWHGLRGCPLRRSRIASPEIGWPLAKVKEKISKTSRGLACAAQKECATTLRLHVERFRPCATKLYKCAPWRGLTASHRSQRASATCEVRLHMGRYVSDPRA